MIWGKWSRLPLPMAMGLKIKFIFCGNHLYIIYNMQKLNLHVIVKLLYCIPLYKLRTIQIFSIKTYKYFLISIKTGRYYTCMQKCMNILVWIMDLLLLVILQVPFLSKGFDIHTCEFLKIYSNKFHNNQHIKIKRL